MGNMMANEFQSLQRRIVAQLRSVSRRRVGERQGQEPCVTYAGAIRANQSGCKVQHAILSFCLCVLFTSGLLLTTKSMAEPIPAITGDVVLTVMGNTRTVEQAGTPIEIDIAILEMLPSTEFQTETPWTDGRPIWTGVRLSDFMEFVGAKSARFKVSALDDYTAVFENVDVEKYPIILAYKKNGNFLSVRDLGPVWIMFPFDDYPELQTQTYNALAVWQLSIMEFL